MGGQAADARLDDEPAQDETVTERETQTAGASARDKTQHRDTERHRDKTFQIQNAREPGRNVGITSADAQTEREQHETRQFVRVTPL